SKEVRSALTRRYCQGQADQGRMCGSGIRGPHARHFRRRIVVHLRHPDRRVKPLAPISGLQSATPDSRNRPPEENRAVLEDRRKIPNGPLKDCRIGPTVPCAPLARHVARRSLSTVFFLARLGIVARVSASERAKLERVRTPFADNGSDLVDF